MMIWNSELLLIIIGLIIGVSAGFVGASAVSIVVPILFVFFQFDILMALGTSLLVDIIGASAIAYLYYKRGNVELRMGLILGLTSFTFAIIGAIFAFMLADFSESVLSGIFGYVNIFLGTMVIINAIMAEKKAKENAVKMESGEIESIPNSKFGDWMETLSPKSKNIFLFLISIFIGINAGMFGAGGGFILTLVLIYILAYKPLKAVGTGTFIMILTASGAFIAYFIRFGVVLGPVSQTICLLFASIIGICSIIGGTIGTKIAHKLSENYLKITLGVIIIIFGIIMIAAN